MIRAPWTPEQVAALNRYQSRGDIHPYTCGGDDCRTDLVATEAGWICPACTYKQDWAHDFMVRTRPGEMMDTGPQLYAERADGTMGLITPEESGKLILRDIERSEEGGNA